MCRKLEKVKYSYLQYFGFRGKIVGRAQEGSRKKLWLQNEDDVWKVGRVTSSEHEEMVEVTFSKKDVQSYSSDQFNKLWDEHANSEPLRVFMALRASHNAHIAKLSIPGLPEPHAILDAALHMVLRLFGMSNTKVRKRRWLRKTLCSQP